MEKPKIKCKPKLDKIVRLHWEKADYGWGVCVVRPDGCSLHLTEEDAKIFERRHWDSLPEGISIGYSRTTGEYINSFVSENLYSQIKVSKKGIRLSEFDEDTAIKNKDLVIAKTCVCEPIKYSGLLECFSNENYDWWQLFH